ncbi:DoxX family protein [Allorhodopirellula heiligendammensis]|uniref:Inner membrane protein YphA n=1 Tax=Allorhodopirellula heiligendammensis TaxID=2714739 RepID=A0A5C6C1W8_9BACT|nr:DoxX family protein [Allorhodopirellula heiligendammensis]TWU16829.1 Inner membrane protein YphA [Allorhodopirellula heiligendammensis]
MTGWKPVLRKRRATICRVGGIAKTAIMADVEVVSLFHITQNALMQGIVSVLGRILIAAIFLLSAVGNKVPNFNKVAEHMAAEGVPSPRVLLAGAIVFLIAGSLSLIAGYKARWGATLLLVFLILASYYFHDFWTLEGAERQAQTIQFMKNLALMGTMLFVIGNGSGAFSLDNRERAEGKKHRKGDF